MERSGNLRADIVLKAFLARDPSGPSLTRFLPDEEKEAFERLPLIEVASHSDVDLLEKIHWSWFLPILKLYPESEQKLFLFAFPPYAEKNLAKTLTLSLGGEGTTEIGKVFLRKILLDSLLEGKGRPFPVNALPKSALNRLLYLEKKELTHLIDRLSFYDLSMALRQIVETKILKKLYSLLTDEERRFLKGLSQYKDQFGLGKFGLERWDGTEETLRTLLHRRGLVRFAAGLSGQDPDLIWYICHQLDIGRGSVLAKLCQEKPIEEVTEAIIKQIEEHL